jgi:4-amino-4-deoxy-L-arabinose transferase-like glycosyltransferase
MALAPDEAQYWTWSQALDWAFYSKPPAIAWQIALTTGLFGSNQVGVGLGALILGTGASLATYAIARNCGLSERRAAWAGLLFALSSAGMMTSLLSTTDCGLVCCWAVAWALLCRRSHWVWIGLVVMLGALYKWPMYAIWIFWVPVYLHRRNPWPLVGAVAISLLGLIPSIVWNAQHDWATLRHVSTQMVQKTVGLGLGRPAGYLVAQVAMFSPLAFALWGYSLWKLRKWRGALGITVWSSGIILLGGLIWSCCAALNANWFVWLYPLAAVVACAVVREAWLRWACLVALLCSAFALTIPYLQKNDRGPHMPWKWNPLLQTAGWEHLTKPLDAVGYDPEKHFLVADTYQMASLLSFYSPGQKRAYFLNLNHRRRNQFSYWPQVTDEVGKAGLFVVSLDGMSEAQPLLQVAEAYEQRLAPYFERVELLGLAPLWAAYGEVVRVALFFEVARPTGRLPSSSSRY